MTFLIVWALLGLVGALIWLITHYWIVVPHEDHYGFNILTDPLEIAKEAICTTLAGPLGLAFVVYLACCLREKMNGHS